MTFPDGNTWHQFDAQGWSVWVHASSLGCPNTGVRIIYQFLPAFDGRTWCRFMHKDGFFFACSRIKLSSLQCLRCGQIPVKSRMTESFDVWGSVMKVDATSARLRAVPNIKKKAPGIGSRLSSWVGSLNPFKREVAVVRILLHKTFMEQGFS